MNRRFIQRWYETTISAPVTRVYGGRRGLFNYYKSKFDYVIGRYRSLTAVNWGKVDRLVFVCLGNVCRSPYAESVAKRYGLDSVSFGVETSDGNPADDRAIALARERGIDLSCHTTTRLENYVPAEGDLVIGMEMSHIKRFNEKVKGAEVVQKTLLGLCLGGGVKPYIHDPYSGGNGYFRQCYKIIDECLCAISSNINKNREVDVVSPLVD